MIECYKYSAPLALGTKNIDSNDLLFAQSSVNQPGWLLFSDCYGLF